MSTDNENKILEKQYGSQRRSIVITFLGSVMSVVLILVTLEVSHRQLIAFVSTQEKYILSMETTMLAIFMIEMLARLITLRLHTPQLAEYSSRLRLVVRIAGYFISLVSVISILASNPALGISVGAIAGVVIAFATQNIVGGVLAAIVILSSRMVRVGEEITVSQTTGIVSDINLTHVVLSVEGDVVFVPNSLIVTNIVQRKKRNAGKGADVRKW